MIELWEESNNSHHVELDQTTGSQSFATNVDNQVTLQGIVPRVQGISQRVNQEPCYQKIRYTARTWIYLMTKMHIQLRLKVCQIIMWMFTWAKFWFPSLWTLGAAVSLIYGDMWDSIKLSAACNIDPVSTWLVGVDGIPLKVRWSV